MKALFLDASSLDFGDLDLESLQQRVNLHCYPLTDSGQVPQRSQGADILIVNKVVLDSAVLEQLPDLKLILIAATGTNNVDLDYAGAHGIRVCHCQGYGTASVVQHVFSLLLALSTRLLDYDRSVREGAWERSDQFCLLDFPIMELAGKTLGIVGYGELGKGVARLARAFGMEVLLAQRPGGQEQPKRLALEALLPRVDVLSLHCPLTDSTRNLIGRRELYLMKPGAILLNVARGGIVDEEALAEVLLAGHLGGAGVDVLTQEPPKGGNRLLQGDIPHLIVTPHCAWGSLESRQRIVEQLAENIRAWQDGKPIRVVA